MANVNFDLDQIEIGDVVKISQGKDFGFVYKITVIYVISRKVDNLIYIHPYMRSYDENILIIENDGIWLSLDVNEDLMPDYLNNIILKKKMSKHFIQVNMDDVKFIPSVDIKFHPNELRSLLFDYACIVENNDSLPIRNWKSPVAMIRGIGVDNRNMWILIKAKSLLGAILMYMDWIDSILVDYGKNLKGASRFIWDQIDMEQYDLNDDIENIVSEFIDGGRNFMGDFDGFVELKTKKENPLLAKLRKNDILSNRHQELLLAADSTAQIEFTPSRHDRIKAKRN